MKAAVCTEYGPPEVLQIQEVAKPSPKDREVLIRIKATTVTAEGPKMRSATFDFSLLLNLIGRIVLGVRKPRHPIMGFELAGDIEAIGSGVTRFRKGDQVYGYTGISFGAHAEYKCMPDDGVLAVKPTTMSYQEAAAVPNGALTALVYLRDKAHIQSGDKVLINGASGSVGTFAVQLAKIFGADVTGVCSARNLDLVTSLGADRVMDYVVDDFTQNGETYDIIFDTVSKRSFSQCKGSLKENGRYLLTVFGLPEMLHMLWTSAIGGKKLVVASSNLSWRSEDLDFLRDLIEAGNLRSVIDRRYPLAQIAEAHRYVETGHKRGNVVITV